MIRWDDPVDLFHLEEARRLTPDAAASEAERYRISANSMPGRGYPELRSTHLRRAGIYAWRARS